MNMNLQRMVKFMGKGNGQGWKGESRRHAMSRMGYKTVLPDGRRLHMGNFVAGGELALSYEMTGGKARNFDFGEGYGETWELWIPDFYDMTKEEVLKYLESAVGKDYMGEYNDKDKDELIDDATELWHEQESPMMNYIYPLGQDFRPDDDTYKKLNNMTIVTVDDEDYLALTGGGMDMTWQIAETYVNLGYFPPSDYCDLPGMAGKDYKSKKNQRIIEACKESLDAVSERALRTKKNIDRLG